MPAQTRTPVVTRIDHSLGFREFLHDIGAPVDRAFQRAGLPVLGETGDVLVPMSRVLRMFAEMAQRETPDLGWHVGQWRRTRGVDEDLLAHIAASPTLYSGLLEFKKLVRLENSGIRLGLVERPRDVVFWVENPLPGLPGYCVAQSYSLQVMIDIVREFVGARWQPAEIGIQSAEVPRVVQEMYPHTRIVPARDKQYVAIDKALLTRQPEPAMSAPRAEPSSDPVTLDHISLSETLRRMLRAYLADGRAGIEMAADLTGLTVRTLQRRLGALGVSYSGVVDHARFDVAASMLTETDASITEIANLTGYSDSSHFARAFRRLCGVNPVQYRSHERSTE